MEKENVYLKAGEIWLPVSGVELSAWACVACDQYTSQPEYWAEVEQLVGNKPSTSKLVVPECFLGEAEQRIPAVHQEMNAYLKQGIVEPKVREGFVLTERSTGSGARVGLVCLMDLEGYDYREGSCSLIRPTEGTIEDRIPLRQAIRRDATLEMSHVMMLVDDVMASVVEPLYEKRGGLEVLYDFPLMMGGGHVKGYAVTDPADVSATMDALSALLTRQEGNAPLLYAVGDGNHSLAAAKACWEEVKATLPSDSKKDHPTRYALVELENIHDDALTFEPIHRVLTGYDGDDLLNDWADFAMQHGMSLAGDTAAQVITCVFEGKQVEVSVSGSTQLLAVGTLQAFLDAWGKEHPHVSLDYVHGEQAVRALAAGERTVGFLLPAINKNDLFETVRREGTLPRKAFSMGEAHEKRYYLETRKLM